MKYLIFTFGLLCSIQMAFGQMVLDRNPAFLNINNSRPTPVVAITHLDAEFEFTNATQPMLDTMSTMFKEMEPRVVKVRVVIPPAHSAEKVAIQLGSSTGSNDIFSKEFDLSATGSLPDGTSHSVQGANHYFEIGEYSGLSNYHLGAYTILSDGSHTETVNQTVQ